MSRARSRTKSQLANTTKRNALLDKIAALLAQSARHVVIQKGDSFRANAADLDNVAIDSSLDYDNIQFQRPPLADGKEQTDVTCVADAGVKEVTTVSTVADSGGSLNSKYFTFSARNSGGATSTNYYVWFNINSAGVDPAVGGATGIQVAGATDATANTLATAARAAITSAAGTKVTVSGSTNQIIITGNFAGNPTNAADGAAPTGFTIATSTAGVASSLLNKYFIIYSAEDATKYYVWFNVNSEGTDPAVASATAIPVAIAVGATATAVATALQSAVDANADFVATRSTTTVSIVNAAAGYATDTADGAGGSATGFTITKIGELEMYDSADITLIKRLRTKKYLIKIGASADAAHDE